MWVAIVVLVLPVVTGFHGTLRPQSVQLLNNNWTIYSVGLRIPHMVHTAVPMDLCTALTSGHFIENMLKDDNHLAYHWVADQPWRYVTQFSTPVHLYKVSKYLVFEGIDTIAIIRLNGHLVAIVQNMFIRHRFNIQPFLQTDVNYLEIFLSSPIQSADEIFTKLKKETKVKTIPPDRPVNIANADRHINYLRKQQSSFGSPMTPSIPNAGIWKSVYIEPYDYSKIRFIQVRTDRKSDGYWNVNLIVHMETWPNLVMHGTSQVNLIDPLMVSKTYQSVKYVRLATDASGACVYSDQLTIDAAFVSLWWPNGYGDQKLYNLTVNYVSTGLVLSKSVQIGFRLIELKQNPIEEFNGFTFFFQVNSVPIFIKGTIWVPSTLFLNDESEENKRRIFNLLKSAQMANMNMIRVWGGGVYESDYFYEVADILGLLVWQDFMFNEALYPATDSFKKSVEKEVQEQVLRLHYHPSLVLWCGNSRSELFLQEYRSQSMQERRAYYLQDYRDLFVDVIKATVDRTDNTRPFVISTPSNGRLSEAYNFTSTTPNEPRFGDLHFITDAINVWDASIYTIPRFSSQSGIQSMPHFSTLVKATKAPQKHLLKFSKFINERQSVENGNELMDQRVNHYLKLPRLKDGLKTFQIFIYYSQVVQAMALKIQIEKYRSFRSRFTASGEGGTMGTLIWHLNDAWQAPTASTIDFDGRWKIAQYFAKNFYAPIIVTGEIIDDTLLVYVVSDEITNRKNLTLRVAVHQWSEFSPVFLSNTQVNINGLFSNVVFERSVKFMFKKSDCDKYKCFIYMSLLEYASGKVVEFSYDAARVAPDNYILPVPIRNAVGLRSGIITKRVLMTSVDKKTLTIELQTPTIAAFVWLRSSFAGHFSDNGFMMVTPTKRITFKSQHSINKRSFEESLLVVSTGYLNNC